MNRLIKFAKHIYRDEQGAEGLEKLLILAAVILPLLGLLIFAKDYIAEWVGEEVETVQEDGGYSRDSGAPPGLGG